MIFESRRTGRLIEVLDKDEIYVYYYFLDNENTVCQYKTGAFLDYFKPVNTADPQEELKTPETEEKV
jgi:hypothetical protein